MRLTITELGGRPQVEGYLLLWRNAIMKVPPIFGDSSMHLITYSNWGKAQLLRQTSLLQCSSSAKMLHILKGRRTYKTANLSCKSFQIDSLSLGRTMMTISGSWDI
ncbi:hypothetical protein BJ878DRAFT_497468 [Calycina marina]|uniref:Uncharacterized protein n=1 Tax=Calycina marina TaxID=1763456 RepID=A0A9P8CGY8_9HELO|nr:hypothetical protein BJ878DRAFT_497468 [Calycina marina]